MPSEPSSDIQNQTTPIRMGVAARREINALQQAMMAVIDIARAEGLRDQRVEPEQQAHAEYADGIEDDRADADRADRLRAVGQAADHHDVHYAHRHPAQFSEYDG